MTPEQLAEIKARRAAITSGKWSLFQEDDMPGHKYGVESGRPALKPEVEEQIDFLIPVAYFANESDARFIISAPADIDALLDYIERLEVKLDSVYNAKPQTIAATVESTSAHWPPD